MHPNLADKADKAVKLASHQESGLDQINWWFVDPTCWRHMQGRQNQKAPSFFEQTPLHGKDPI